MPTPERSKRRFWTAADHRGAPDYLEIFERSQYIPARWTNAIVFSVLTLVLVFRPHRLMGEQTPDKA